MSAFGGKADIASLRLPQKPLGAMRLSFLPRLWRRAELEIRQLVELRQCPLLAQDIARLSEVHAEPLAKGSLAYGVTSTARLPPNRRVHPCSILWAQIAAPTRPPRCGRRSLQSRQGRQRMRPDRFVRCASIGSTSMPISARWAMPLSERMPASPVNSTCPWPIKASVIATPSCRAKWS